MNKYRRLKLLLIIVCLTSLFACNLPSSNSNSQSNSPNNDGQTPNNTQSNDNTQTSNDAIENSFITEESEKNSDPEVGKTTFITENQQIVFDSHVVIQGNFESKKPDLLISGGCLEIIGNINQTSEKIELNPPLKKVQINSSCLIMEAFNISDPNFILDIGLGGNEPASHSGYGNGFYSQITTKHLTLNGILNLSFYYGFQPDIGKEYKIFKGLETRTSEFINAAEGDIVGGVCNVGLRISYQGTDGADVSMFGVEAESGNSWPCPNKTQGGNWHELSAWENNTVPSELDHVIISNQNSVVMTNQVVNIEKLTVNNGSLRLVSSCLSIKGEVQVPDMGMDLNPSCLTSDRLVFGNTEGALNIGIGGSDPANPGGQGPGHYSNLAVNQIFMNGDISVSFLYGFQPEEGQIFEIISVNDFGGGMFSNAPESEIIGGICDFGLSISYLGGDGNDVILTAQKVTDPNPDWSCTDILTVKGEQSANCRFGPSSLYNEVGILREGDKAILLGQDFEKTWVYVRLSNLRECWVFAGALTEDSVYEFAEVLPDPPLPPTPTSTTPPVIVSTDTPIPVPVNGSISGTIFKDTNEDGNNAGDSGYPGVNVTLGAGACNSSGLASTNSNGSGSFSFSGLSAGTYCLSAVAPVVGSCPRWDHASTNTKFTINLSSGQNVSKLIGFDNSSCAVD